MDRCRLSGLACLLVTCLFFTLVLFQTGPPAGLPDSKAERESHTIIPVLRADLGARGNGSLPRTASSVVALLEGVVDAFTPSVGLTVVYGKTPVETGVELSPSEAEVSPTVQVEGSPDDLYTLVMLDLDAPSPDAPSEAEWLHWLVTNIPGGKNATAGIDVVTYNGPTPPVGRHRYVFFLFKQIRHIEVQPPAQRNRFKVRMFAQEHELGDPVAATLFHATAETRVEEDVKPQMVE